MVEFRKPDIIRNKLNKEEKSEVLSLYRKNYSIEQIAEMMIVANIIIEQIISEPAI